MKPRRSLRVSSGCCGQRAWCRSPSYYPRDIWLCREENEKERTLDGKSMSVYATFLSDRNSCIVSQTRSNHFAVRQEYRAQEALVVQTDGSVQLEMKDVGDFCDRFAKSVNANSPLRHSVSHATAYYGIT